MAMGLQMAARQLPETATVTVEGEVRDALQLPALAPASEEPRAREGEAGGPGDGGGCAAPRQACVRAGAGIGILRHFGGPGSLRHGFPASVTAFAVTCDCHGYCVCHGFLSQ